MMMADLAAKVLIGMITKLLSETFLARVVIYALHAWAKTTDNHLDDRVVSAMAEALDVPVEKLQP